MPRYVVSKEHPNAAWHEGELRFFSGAFAPKSGHFYSNDAAECAALQRGNTWSLEDAAAFYMMKSADGGCPVGSTPLYRLYNDGQGRIVRTWSPHTDGGESDADDGNWFVVTCRIPFEYLHRG